MRRTTIFRSDVTVIAALLAGIAAVAAAQQPPAIQRPIQQAQQAAGQQPEQRRGEITSPSGNVTMPSQAPATHTVVQGETLWALAQQYLGDPLLWPEIYRLNTTVIEDPHWIYPGEELRITPDAPLPGDTTTAAVVVQSVSVTPAGDTVQVVQAPSGPVASPMTGPTIFSQGGSQFRRSATFEAATAPAYRAVREGEYFSSGFLTENQPLNTGLILANPITERRGVSRSRSSASLNDVVLVQAPPGETLQPGDLLLSLVRGAEVGGYGQIVRPTGQLRVIEAVGDLWSSRIIRMYDQIVDSQEVLKVEPFVNTTSQRAQPVTGGIEGRVIGGRDLGNVAQMQEVLYFDKGANDGVRLGDIFQVYGVSSNEEHTGTVEQDQARAIIVNTRAGTSTGVIVELYRGDVGLRSRIRQIRRMPS